MSSQRGSPKCGMPKQGAIQPMLRFHSLQALSRQLRQLLLLPGVSSLFWCCTYVLCVLCVLLYSCGDTTHANALYTTKVRPMLYTNALRMHYQCTLYCTRYTIHDTLPGIHSGIQYLLHYVGYYVRKRKTPVCFCKAFLPWQVSLPSSCRTCTVVHSLQVTTKTNLLAELKHQAPN